MHGVKRVLLSASVLMIILSGGGRCISCVSCHLYFGTYMSCTDVSSLELPIYLCVRVGLATPSPKSSDTSYICYPSFEGMSELVKVRPENPVEWLASYLVRNDPQKAGAPGPAK